MSNVGRDNLTGRQNRRAEVVFFDPEELPAAHGSEAVAGDGLYASGRYERARLLPLGEDEALLRITLLDVNGEPIPRARFEAQTRAGPLVAEADADGVALVPRALVDRRFRLEWHPPDDEKRRYISLHELSADGETTHGLQRRLANLGFERDGDTNEAVRLFQAFLGLPQTGILGDVTKLINQWHETGVKPTPNPDDYPLPPSPDGEAEDPYEHGIEPEDHDH